MSLNVNGCTYISNAAMWIIILYIWWTCNQ